ncbi:MAG: fumarylacetoacetate hydrolase family protein [Atribacterota bacterium]|nr:fumarylacetoacetate hydrolase family protein [Atribacterota bacterium]MDD4895367.1 fumarylacetoacetate hydrolase family protein [Atribacterota bacterium]MDD5637117.1 fumarylacetoacetate hydrolase family protein [Atribacterota bacterium]
MRIVRYQTNGGVLYGVLQGDEIRTIQGNLFDKVVVGSLRIKREEVKLLAPVDPPNVIAIGLNYKKHAEESGNSFPDKPVIFLKSTSSVIGPEDNIILPEIAPNEVDYEAELVIVIGKKAKNIEIDDVDNYILGYTCGNDVSARDCQLRLDQQWARGKSFDTFCPLGPWIETELPNPDQCRIRSRLNGKVMQDSNTSDLIFGVRELVSYCSKNFTLLPGSVIMTGTPGGVGFTRKPPVYLKQGDIIEIGIEGIGILSNKVV